MSEVEASLGPCCICGGDTGRAKNIVMLNLRNQVPGHGWGCVVCGLPSDGATAVLCDPCCHKWQEGPDEIRFACRGYPGTDGRVAIGELTVPFAHNRAMHLADEIGGAFMAGDWN